MTYYARPWWGRLGRCIHKGHMLGMWCWRPRVHDGYCKRHNKTCGDLD
jgi:hypothetical protein